MISAKEQCMQVPKRTLTCLVPLGRIELHLPHRLVVGVKKAQRHGACVLGVDRKVDAGALLAGAQGLRSAYKASAAAQLQKSARTET